MSTKIILLSLLILLCGLIFVHFQGVEMYIVMIELDVVNVGHAYVLTSTARSARKITERKITENKQLLSPNAVFGTLRHVHKICLPANFQPNRPSLTFIFEVKFRKFD